MTATERTAIPEATLLAALRGEIEIAEVCRVTGVSRDEFAAARRASLMRRLPPADDRLPAAVSGPVEILRDRAGVPHVFAGSTPDLYFGLGYAMAQDRLWQMDRLRRRALGRQAEVLGPDYVKSDLVHRLVGIPEIAASEVERTDERTRRIMEALVAGINRQVERRGKNLPIEFDLLGYEPEPFTVRDSIAILRGIWWSLNGRLESIVGGEAASLLPTPEMRTAFLTPEAPEERIVPAGSPYPAPALPLDAVHEAIAGMGDARGSNNWAVAGSHTRSGHAILGSDPHQPFWLPSSWYEFGLHGPEDDVAGAGHPGVPGLWWGSNRQIAWGITNNGTSTRDLFREEVHPGDPSRYRDGDKWRRFDEREIEISVRGVAPRRLARRATVRGPIMNAVLPSVAEDGAPPLALRWVGHEHLDDVRAAVAIGRARDWPTFRASLRDWAIAVFNFVYADREGDVNFQCAGRIPVRGSFARGYRDANNPADAWQGYVPFDAMPRLENPKRGFVASANNRVAADDYPTPLAGVAAAGYRALRIKKCVEDDGPFDVARSRALQLDVRNLRPVQLCPPLLRRLATSNDPDVRRAVQILDAWEGDYDLDTPGPAVFETFMALWQQRVAAERLPAHLVPLVKTQSGIAARLLDNDDLGWFPSGVRAAIAATAKETIAVLADRFGPDPIGWRWGKVHQAHFRHPLSNAATAPDFDLGPAPVAGGNETVCNTGVGSPPDFAASGGVEYRLAVDFAAPDLFHAVQNIGNSGQPGSPHYGDQFAPWIAGEYHTVALTREGVERDLVGTTVLMPASWNESSAIEQQS